MSVYLEGGRGVICGRGGGVNVGWGIMWGRGRRGYNTFKKNGGGRGGGRGYNRGMVRTPKIKFEHGIDIVNIHSLTKFYQYLKTNGASRVVTSYKLQMHNTQCTVTNAMH
ncbi:hypothetical protein DPMN_024514 [Dreissena polymorpha]|uniref:Uncharacterized protein n=1 Tax=Dreissena polymorpha TaxID=45954 RepID=A0A9D4LPV7_DREPO|nr:hypothetical protein DPMN_024514 [Dreissena polymorpha]